MSERNFTPPPGTPDYLTHQSAPARVSEAMSLIEEIINRVATQEYTSYQLKDDLREVLRVLATP